MGDRTVARGMSASAGDATPSSDTGANCIPRKRFNVRSLGFEVCVVPVSDHSTSEVSTAFFKESISRPIITGR